MASASGDDDDRRRLLAAALPPGFERTVVVVPPGGARPHDDREWRDALVIVARGEIELETGCGRRHTFAAGAVLWLSGLPLRALHNPGRQPAVLVAVRRRRRPPGQRSVL